MALEVTGRGSALIFFIFSNTVAPEAKSEAKLPSVEPVLRRARPEVLALAHVQWRLQKLLQSMARVVLFVGDTLFCKP